MRTCLVALAAVLGLAGCGSDIGEEYPVDVPRPSAQQESAELTELVGSYRYDARPTEAQVRSGAWRLVLGAGRYALTDPNKNRASGRYRVNGRTIVLTGEPCPSPGHYEWAREEGNLVFDLVDDPCANRAAAMIALPWQPTPPGTPEDKRTKAPPESPATGGAWGLDGGADSPALMQGHWVLSLADGQFSITQPDGTEHTGAYQVESEEIVFQGGPCGPEDGRYLWSVERAELRFETVEDPCGNRAAILASAPWDGTEN